jgi:hypothetical protein
MKVYVCSQCCYCGCRGYVSGIAVHFLLAGASGVELRVDPVAAERYEQLAGLTARERRIMRVRWKKERERQLQVQQAQLRPESVQQVRLVCRCVLPQCCAHQWCLPCTSRVQTAVCAVCATSVWVARVQPAVSMHLAYVGSSIAHHGCLP